MGPKLYAGGRFDQAGSLAAIDLARWNGTSWSSVGNIDGPDASTTNASALAVFDDGTDGTPDLYVGGAFRSVAGITSGNIAERHGCGSPGQPLCAGDGTAAACPCANMGAPGHGCASALHAAGAWLANTGHASVANDTLALHASALSGNAALFFQGTSAAGGGAGITFGDGLRCASGTLLRLAALPTLNAASNCPAIGAPPVSILGGIPFLGGSRVYQIWYRDGASFCTPSTFNLTNGLRICWTL